MTSKRSEAIMKKNMKKNEINSQTQVQQEKLQLRNKDNNCKSLAAQICTTWYKPNQKTNKQNQDCRQYKIALRADAVNKGCDDDFQVSLLFVITLVNRLHASVLAKMPV